MIQKLWTSDGGPISASGKLSAGLMCTTSEFFNITNGNYEDLGFI
jgi:hypothetical protein